MRTGRPGATRTAGRLVGGLLAVVLLAVVLLAGGAVGCTSAASTLTFCTDPTDPPAEFYQVQQVGTQTLKRQLAGADIDIGTAVAKSLGRPVSFVNTPFNQIIGALQARQCDAIISFINDTPQRRRLVTFVDYLAAGQMILLPNGAPAVSQVPDLYGRTVSVQQGTTGQQFLQAQNARAPTGRPIKILSFASDNDAIYALQHGAVGAYFGDAPVVIAAAEADHSLMAGAQLVPPIPVGVAVRPGDPLRAQVAQAIKSMYQDGRMGTILSKWGWTRYALAG
jgi:polar amino acid transport system substrate-binding protein